MKVILTKQVYFCDVLASSTSPTVLHVSKYYACTQMQTVQRSLCVHTQIIIRILVCAPTPTQENSTILERNGEGVCSNFFILGELLAIKDLGAPDFNQ